MFAYGDLPKDEEELWALALLPEKPPNGPPNELLPAENITVFNLWTMINITQFIPEACAEDPLKDNGPNPTPKDWEFAKALLELPPNYYYVTIFKGVYY